MGDVQNSLREIAELLLLLHESYLSESIGSTAVVEALLLFVRDIGLGDAVSLIEVERCRREIMAPGDTYMGYEHFYEWLRIISKVAYQDQEGDYRRALHHMLMQNVIPAASQEKTLGCRDTAEGGSGGPGNSSSGAATSSLPTLLYDPSTLNVLLACSSFLKLWYMSIISGAPLEHFASVETLWRRNRSQAVDRLSWEARLLESFERIGLLPGFISRMQVQACIEKHVGAKVVTFNAFLLVLDEVGERANFSTAHEAMDLEFSLSYSAPPSSDIRMLCLLQIVAESLLSNSIARFASQTGEGAAMGGDALLLLLRRAWLLGRRGHSLQAVYNEALIYADCTHGAGAPMWSLDTMKISLSSVVEFVTGTRADEPGLNLDKFSPGGRVTVYLLMLAPGLFFATQQPSAPSQGLFTPSFLAPSGTGMSAYQQSWPLVDHIFRSCEPTDRPANKSVDSSEDEEPALSLISVLRCLERGGVVPRAISPSMLAHACDLVLGEGVVSAQPTLCCIMKVDLLEILFVLAQLSITETEPLEPQTRFALFLSLVQAAVEKSAPAVAPAPVALRGPENTHKPLSDVTLLLMHFPLNSLQLNPWAVKKLAARHSQGGTTLTGLLPLLFKEFCDKFELSAQALGAFFSAFFVKKNGFESTFDGSNTYMLHDVKSCLSVSLYPLFLHDRVLKLLQRNQLLLHWEFFKCTARSYGLTSTIITDPLPNHRHLERSGSFAVVSMDAAVLWAQRYIRLSFDEALGVFQSTKLLGGARDSHEMVFSSFVIFAVRCFTLRAVQSGGAAFGVEAAAVLLREMLETFSANLTKAQMALEVNVTTVLEPFSTQTNSADKSALLRFSFAAFNRRSDFTKSELFLPPKPPRALMDAPRFLSYCKFGGFTARTKGLLLPWRAFGAALRALRVPTVDAWKPSVVAPLPIRIDPAAVRGVLGHMISSPSLTKEDAIDEALLALLAPLMMMYVDDDKMGEELEAGAPGESSSHSLFVEDLLRYGGQAVVSALEARQQWVAQAYMSCKSSPDEEEASQKRSLAFFCCGGLLDAAAVDASVKHSMHPRLRRNTLVERRLKPGPPLARCEYEELLLRCAYSVWVLSGAAAEILPDATKLYESLRTPDLDSAELRALTAVYCGAAVEAMTSRGGDACWGVDFLSPFVATLERLQSDAPPGGLLAKSGSLERLSDRSSASSPRSPSPRRNGSDSELILQTILADEEYYSQQADEERLHGEPLNPAKYSSTASLLDGTKENLWPVYATYCSCGDSTDPGKLSGPNLFTLLSKLGILTNRTNLSDVGILIHQVSAHTQSLAVSLDARISPNDIFEPPSLAFEEFLVFLCAFSQLYYDCAVTMPMFSKAATMGAGDSVVIKSAGGKEPYAKWQDFLETSACFHRLLAERILPILKRYPLLAFPDDARQRDRYSMVFSLEVLLAVEGCEKAMLQVFERNSYKHSQQNSLRAKITPIALALKQLIPQTIDESQLFQLVNDVLPEVTKSPRSLGSSNSKTMLFPQWEWVLCIISFHAIEFGCSSPDQIEPKLVGELVVKITDVMSTLMNE